MRKCKTRFKLVKNWVFLIYSSLALDGGEIRESCGCEQRFLSSLTEKKEQGTSVSQGTVGTEITSDLRDISLLSLEGICQLLPGLRDPPCKSKDGFFFNAPGATFSTWEPRSLASSGVKWLACTKR